MRPLYNWEIEIKEDNEKLKKEFVSLYSSKLNLNNRFITFFERIDIKEEYDLKDEILDEIIDESNESFIKKNEPIFLNQFLNELNSCDKFIDDKSRVEFHYKYSTDYYDYYESLKFDNYVDDHNEKILENQKEILNEFKQDLYKCKPPIDYEDIEKFKTKYNRDGHDYFIELRMHDLIKKFNFNEALHILIKKYGRYNSPISDSELVYLDHQYPEFDWEEIIEEYNKKYFVKKTRPNISDKDVYYLTEYIRKNDWKTADSNKVKTSKEILKYKDGVPEFVIKYTDRIIKFIEFFANYGLEKNFDKIFLVSIPSSTKKRNARSSMKKSIDIIEDEYKKELLKFNKGREREIINCKDLLIRSEDIEPAHLSNERPGYTDHMRTISFNKHESIDLNNSVFFLLDDITTRGKIMKACTDILVKNGIERSNVYRFAIARTASNYKRFK